MTQKKIQIREILTKGQFRCRFPREGLTPQILLEMTSRELSFLHPVDIAELIVELPLESRINLLNLLSKETASDVLARTGVDEQLEFAKAMEAEKLSRLLEEMDTEDAADFLAQLSPKKMDAILNLMNEEDRNEAIELLCYDQDSAGGVMGKELVDFYPEITVGKALEMIRTRFQANDFLTYFYITDRQSHLLGTVSLKELVLADSSVHLGEIMETDVISVNIDDDQEKVAWLATKYELAAIPVVNGKNQLVGMVSPDNISMIIEEEHEEDIYKMAGLDEGGANYNNPFRAALFRLPWLITTFVGGILTSAILENTHSADFPWILNFVPMILGLGGNVGIQTSTLIVRNLATRQFSQSVSFSWLFKEIFTGLSLAFLCATVMMFLVASIRGDWLQGIVLALCLFSVILIASIVSVVIPISFQKIGFDPAVASGPFVTVFTDVCGLFLYLHAAYFILQLLVRKS